MPNRQRTHNAQNNATQHAHPNKTTQHAQNKPTCSMCVASRTIENQYVMAQQEFTQNLATSQNNKRTRKITPPKHMHETHPCQLPAVDATNKCTDVKCARHTFQIANNQNKVHVQRTNTNQFKLTQHRIVKDGHLSVEFPNPLPYS